VSDQQPVAQACPGSTHLTGGFRQHQHGVTCAGDVDDERQPHTVHLARCTPHGHVCPSCALDWPQVAVKWPRPGYVREETYQADRDSARRIKDALNTTMRRKRERDEERLRAREDRT
jgi:hypothetical protein